MDFTGLKARLKDVEQGHLLRFWDSLSALERASLLSQCARLPPALLQRQRALLKKRSLAENAPFSPFTSCELSGDPAMVEEGSRAIAAGKVGCLLVAGGQGTRLKLKGPKGLYPITPVMHKTLFQIFAERVDAAGNRINQKLALAVMTSPANHGETVGYFLEHGSFGLDEDQLDFFTQDELPLLNDEGNWFLDSPGQVAFGPDGNGGAIPSFINSGVWQKWKDQGIEWVNWVLVDNPLADPFDANLVGSHITKRNEVTIKVVEREDPQEKVGVLVRDGQKARVAEYSELPKAIKEARNGEGKLQHNLANLSLFCFSMDFIGKVAQDSEKLPLHVAHKAVPYVDKQGHRRTPEGANAWKFEKFIFDILPWSDRVSAVIYPREECFAPLKNIEGSDSPEMVKKALQRRDRAVMEGLTGFPAAVEPLELDPVFYYPTEKIKKDWHGRELTQGGYVSP